MKNYILAEKLKYRHTFMKKIVIMMPLIVIILSAGLTHEYFAVDSYNWWYMGLYPGMIGIVCGIIGEKDKKKKYNTIWSLPCSMKKIWDAKVIVGAAWSGIAVSFVVILSIVIGKCMKDGLHMMLVIQPTVKAQLVAGFIMWLTTLWQIPFCLWLSQKIGSFMMFIVHMGSYIIFSAIISLKSWFMVFPGAITSRLMCPILGILPNGLLALEGQKTYTPELVEIKNLLIGIPAAVFWLFIFWWGSRKWFKRQVTI